MAGVSTTNARPCCLKTSCALCPRRRNMRRTICRISWLAGAAFQFSNLKSQMPSVRGAALHRVSACQADIAADCGVSLLISPCEPINTCGNGRFRILQFAAAGGIVMLRSRGTAVGMIVQTNTAGWFDPADVGEFVWDLRCSDASRVFQSNRDHSLSDWQSSPASISVCITVRRTGRRDAGRRRINTQGHRP